MGPRGGGGGLPQPGEPGPPGGKGGAAEPPPPRPMPRLRGPVLGSLRPGIGKRKRDDARAVDSGNKRTREEMVGIEVISIDSSPDEEEDAPRERKHPSAENTWDKKGSSEAKDLIQATSRRLPLAVS